MQFFVVSFVVVAAVAGITFALRRKTSLLHSDDTLHSLSRALFSFLGRGRVALVRVLVCVCVWEGDGWCLLVHSRQLQSIYTYAKEAKV